MERKTKLEKIQIHHDTNDMHVSDTDSQEAQEVVLQRQTSHLKYLHFTLFEKCVSGFFFSILAKPSFDPFGLNMNINVSVPVHDDIITSHVNPLTFVLCCGDSYTQIEFLDFLTLQKQRYLEE